MVAEAEESERVSAGEVRSGKGHKDENFPVASLLVAAKYRAPILSFYRFARVADDVADHPDLPPPQKLALLDSLEASLVGASRSEPEGVALRGVLAERKLTPQHALDLLKAFRLDVTKSRYESFDELMEYCRYSAMPVGRFVLDVHGENHATWAASDAICAALQINNHLQDCGKDYRDLDRVYLPLDALAAAGAKVEALGEARATPALRACLAELARRTRDLLDRGGDLPAQISDARLSVEIGATIDLAYAINGLLLARDPLNEPVHLAKTEMLRVTLAALGRGMKARLTGGGRRGAEVRSK
ncbi:MAG TPA: squalene synthase HpnC [Beijerinckiaceae bacterium]|jgi:squalene synthase HpnC|nr:squalene synthase HpnC [Beijerinckiaceae bacterium]